MKKMTQNSKEKIHVGLFIKNQKQMINKKDIK